MVFASRVMSKSELWPKWSLTKAKPRGVNNLSEREEGLPKMNVSLETSNTKTIRDKERETH